MRKKGEQFVNSLISKNWPSKTSHETRNEVVVMDVYFLQVGLFCGVREF